MKLNFTEILMNYQIMDLKNQKNPIQNSHPDQIKKQQMKKQQMKKQQMKKEQLLEDMHKIQMIILMKTMNHLNQVRILRVLQMKSSGMRSVKMLMDIGIHVKNSMITMVLMKLGKIQTQMSIINIDMMINTGSGLQKKSFINTMVHTESGSVCIR